MPAETDPRAAVQEPPIDEKKAQEPPGEEEGVPGSEKDEDTTQYPGGRTLAVILLALYLAVLLVALDRTIITTAIPRITDEFHSLSDIGWYGSSYMLTSCALQLTFGRVYTFYSPKWVFLFAIGLFEIGSAISGAAPNSTSFIIGRAVAGLGASGIFSGAVIIITHTVPLRKRPAYTGLLGAVFGIASVAGPLLGGAFTDKLTWRWCFYINLPIGAVTVLVIYIILKMPQSSVPAKESSTLDKISQLDPLGTLALVPCTVCLLLALQWGGSTYPWNDGRIIALLVLFGVLLVVFIAIQMWRKEDATVPPRIIKQRSIAAGFFFTICVGSAMNIIVYYLPIWFQAIKGASAVKSGIMSIPMILALVIGSIMAGGLVTALGYYTPFMIASAILMSIGVGLLTTFTTETGHPKWIGYQVLLGFGIGLGMQQSNMAVQTILSNKDIPTGAALMFFAQSLGGAIFVSVGQNVFSNSLLPGLSGIPGLEPNVVMDTGATALKSIVDPTYLDGVLHAYNGALVSSYQVALILACVSILGALPMEWKSVKGKKGDGKDEIKEDGKSGGDSV
ncbi:hypothetical protein FQN54_005159 [Arachnomyces sp. PD_36]|nr:hypothetical protein FQN54_005159 [Arachnomyces sp. PD_36]